MYKTAKEEVWFGTISQHTSVTFEPNKPARIQQGEAVITKQGEAV
jgi:hypothetical protein